MPQDMPIFSWIISECITIARSYGYTEIQTPLVENTDLFCRSVGEETDIVSKEMFSFKDQGGDNITLRPEMTASIIRAYIEHGLINQPKPLKLFQTGRCYRYERPQSGRLREFQQFDAEIIGAGEPICDAELIAVAYAILKRLGLDVIMQVSSLGTPESRKNYIKTLKQYYQPKMRHLCKDCTIRFKTNPLRMLDCKKKKCVEYIMESPQIVDHLDEESKAHLTKVLEYLDAFDLPYALNPQIVRGLDYYTKTVFEIWMKDDAEGSRTGALGGGGRYDGLVELLGGRETEASGFALGIERIASRLRENALAPVNEEKFDIFLAQLGEEARKRAFVIFEDLRAKGYRVFANLCKGSLKQQLEIANKAKVRLTLILGEKEVAENSILIKEMDIGAQESVPLDKLDRELGKRLKV